MKKLVSLLLTLVMILTLIVTLSVQAVADTTTFYSKLSAFKNQKYAHNSIYKDNPNLTGGSQCFGYANELALYIWGSYPTKSMSAKTVNSGWKVTYGGSAVDNLCVGDIVRYRYHSIFITGISGDTIYYCHANSPSGTNKVTYDNTISRSTLKSRVSEKLTSPNTTKTGWVAHFIQNAGASGQVVDMSEGSSSSNNASSNTAGVSSVKISPNSYPSGNLKYGNDFTLTAKFTSDCAIVEARAYMLDSNKNVIMEAKGSSTTGNYYVEGYALDKGMKFNELSPGGYYLKYYVKDANGDTNTWTSDKFYIVKEEEKKPVVDMSTIDSGSQSTPKEPESTLSINLTNCPSSIENGESVLLMGTIASNYLIKEAKVVIFASNGIGYYPTTIYPNSKSVRIENTDLSDGIYFEGMPGGTYTLEITAKDEKTTKEITKSIKISERKIEEDDDLYSADIDIEINSNKNDENTKKQKCGNKAYWDFNNGVLTISGSGKMNDYSSPWELPWYDIQSDVRKIVIEEGITYIGNNAFCWHGANSNNSINIEEIYIPSTVEGLGNCTFAYVDGVDTVYYNARDCEFAGTSLTFAYNYFARGTKLVIGEDVERIGANVFYRGRFDEVVCEGDWDEISVDMTGNEVLDCIETENNDGGIVVKVDGRKVKFDQPPIIQDGRTLVPVRAACEAMGINVQWIEAEQRVVLTKYGEEFDMQIGNKKYWMNQVSYYYFDVPPQIINGRTLLPIRAIAQFFGYDVDWNGNTQTVIIESE